MATIVSSPGKDGYNTNLDKFIEASGLVTCVVEANRLTALTTNPTQVLGEFSRELGEQVAKDLQTAAGSPTGGLAKPLGAATGKSSSSSSSVSVVISNSPAVLDLIKKPADDAERTALNRVVTELCGNSPPTLLSMLRTSSLSSDVSKTADNVLRWGKAAAAESSDLETLKRLMTTVVTTAPSKQDGKISEADATVMSTQLKTMMDDKPANDWVKFIKQQDSDVKNIKYFHKQWASLAKQQASEAKASAVSSTKSKKRVVRIKVPKNPTHSTKSWEEIMQGIQKICKILKKKNGMKKLTTTPKLLRTTKSLLVALQLRMRDLYRDTLKVSKCSMLRVGLLRRVAEALKPNGYAVEELRKQWGLDTADKVTRNSVPKMQRMISSFMYRKTLWNDNATELHNALGVQPIKDVKEDLQQLEDFASVDPDCSCGCIESIVQRLQDPAELDRLVKTKDLDKTLHSHTPNSSNALINVGRDAILRAVKARKVRLAEELAQTEWESDDMSVASESDDFVTDGDAFSD